MARWRHDDAVVDVSASNTIRLAVSLRDNQRVRCHAGGAAVASPVRVGSVSVFSAREPSKVAVQGRADILQIFLPSALLDRVIGEPSAYPALFDPHDPELQGAALQLLVGATKGGPDGRLLLEGGLHRVARRLVHHAGSIPRGPVRGGLSPSACRRVDEVIVAAFHDPGVKSPTLGQLADAARLSVSHFIRAFRQQTGTTPYRHILRRRLERAIALFDDPGKSVAEVADDTGFATQAHFVATFRRAMGVTPGAVRDALLG